MANLASSLSTRANAGQTLIGPRAFAAVEESVETARVGEFDLQGFARPVTAYEVLRRSSERSIREPGSSIGRTCTRKRLRHGRIDRLRPVELPQPSNVSPFLEATTGGIE